MKLQRGLVQEKGLCSAVRDELTCGRCTASTLLVWRAKRMGSGPRDAATITVVDEAGAEVESADILVRCSFFRMNIPQPDTVLVCEGFKDRRSKSERSSELAEDVA